MLADGSTPPDWVAMDLFSQAEHDELAQSILLCPDAGYIAKVQAEPSTACCPACRAAIVIRAIAGRPRRADPDTRSMEEACAISNRIAPSTWRCQPRPASLGAAAAPRRRDLPRRLTSEPGRLLRRAQPRAATSGTARFSSPLGVYDFRSAAA